MFDDAARALAAAHWPGPLTLVVPLRPDAGIASLVTAGLPSIALRVPAHPAMQALLAACGRPLAAPSANASGRISPTRAAHVVASLGERIALVIDGGATQRGIESTIVAATGGPLRLLRRGPIEVDAVFDDATHRSPRPARQPLRPAQAAAPRRDRGARRRISDRLRRGRRRRHPERHRQPGRSRRPPVRPAPRRRRQPCPAHRRRPHPRPRPRRRHPRPPDAAAAPR